MGIKISNSGMNRYSACGKSYEFHYIRRYRSLTKSSALCFGTAIDAGCNYMLENFDNRTTDPNFLSNAIDIFLKTWTAQTDRDIEGETSLRLNPNIKYFKSDYDLDVLLPSDLEELGLDSPEAIEDYNNGREIIHAELKNNGGKWLDIPIEDRIEYNEVLWFCLMRKGQAMLAAYYNEILPQFKRILFLQKPIELADEEGNLVNGIAEFAAELLDGRICLVDNKSAGQPYEPESVETSQQLALYYRILDINAQTEGSDWKTSLDCAAYAVLLKKMVKEKTKTCQSCGHIATGSHKLCDAKNAAGQRCNGEWTVVTSVFGATQFVIGNIDEDFGNTVLENASTIVACIDKKIFPKNFNKCYDNYGSVCEFLSLCHKGDSSGVIKLKDKDGEK